MTRASGRKAHSHGAQFETYLEDVEFAHLLNDGFFRRVDKQHPRHVKTGTVKRRAVFTPSKQSGADWIAQGGGGRCPWAYIAIEAKATDSKSLARSRISDEQAQHLQDAEDGGQLGLLIVRFGDAAYAVRWSERLFVSRGKGFSLRANDIAAINRLSSLTRLKQVLLWMAGK